MSDFGSELARLREEINALDDKIFPLLKSRFEVVEKVAELKGCNLQGKSFIRPAREVELIRKIAAYDFGKADKVSMVRLMRGLIAASLSIEQGLRICYPSTGNSYSNYYWLAREFFGASSIFTRVQNANRVISEIIEKKDQIGILPLPQDTEELWWVSLADSTRAMPKVFAQLPGYESDEKGASQEPAALAVGNVDLEPSQDDITLIAFSVAEGLSRAKVSTLWQKLGVRGNIIATTATDSRQDLVWYLFEAQGFMLEGGDVLTKFRQELGKGLLILKVIGAYAAPVKV